MTDIEVYKKFMSWIGMEIVEQIELENGNILLDYQDKCNNDVRFTTRGYEEFCSGVIFDKEGNLVKAYLDSHVCGMSENAKLIYNIIKQNKLK